jgi:hypothetical protein
MPARTYLSNKKHVRIRAGSAGPDEGEAWFLQTQQQVHADGSDHLIRAYLIHRIRLAGNLYPEEITIRSINKN